MQTKGQPHNGIAALCCGLQIFMQRSLSVIFYLTLQCHWNFNRTPSIRTESSSSLTAGDTQRVRLIILSKQVFGQGHKSELSTTPFAGNMKSCFNNPMAIMSSSNPTTGSTDSTYLQQWANMVALAVRFTLDETISLNGLLLVLVSTIAHIVCAVPLHTVTLASAFVIAALTACKIHEAYNFFMALGPGSIPANDFLRAMQIARQDVITTSTGYLSSPSLRSGSTPYVVGIAPQRQIDQSSPEDVQNYCTDRLALFASLQSESSNSSTGYTTATRSSSCRCPPDTSLRTFGCNTCCPHGSDGSVHVILHPSDLQTVLQNGWGELHPYANTGSRYAPSGVSSYMPATLALIYAPRTYPEVCTVMTIVEAGSKYLASLEGK